MFKTKARSKSRFAILAAALAIVMSLSLVGTSVASAAYNGPKYYPGFNSMDEAKIAAEQLTEEIGTEGFILMKNQDNALPLTNKLGGVSVFGVTQDALVGASKGNPVQADNNIAEALETQGFKVNPTLWQYYSTTSGSEGNEVTKFSGIITSSFDQYNEAAVVVFSRDGGEGSDVKTVTSEKATDEDVENHLALNYKETTTPAAEEGAEPEVTRTYYKHGLMLTEKERALIDLVTDGTFKKVIVVLNTSNTMEIAELKNNPKIDAIIDIGRPGEGGCNALAKILDGTVSPSGGLVDQWAADLTADPVWYNFGDNGQTAYGDNAGSTMMRYSDGTATGSAGTSTDYSEGTYYVIDYEESIYLGYRYYETRYWEIHNEKGTEAANEWYEKNVIYPFGYGLNYTTFSFNAKGIFTDAALTNNIAGTDINQYLFESYEGHVAEVKKLYIPVVVKNTGAVAGKKTVQVYVEAPYMKGEIEKSSVVLVGFAKTDILAPGASQTVVIEVNVQDFASWDGEDLNENLVKGDFELDAGNYYFKIMENAHFDFATDLSDKNDAFDELSFNLTADCILGLDDFSDGKLENLFSAEQGVYGDETEVGDMAFYSVRAAEMMADNESGMTLLSRADFEGTFPQAPKAGDLQFKDNIIDNYSFWENFAVDDEGGAFGAKEDTPDMPWYKTADDIPENWTQAAGVYDPDYRIAYNRTTMNWPINKSNAAECPIKFADMAGVAYDDPLWDEFLNQLTYDELCTIVEFGGYCTSDLPSVGKLKHDDTDGPNVLDGTHYWCSEDIIASTFNVDLANKEGKMMGDLGLLHGVQGWYAPGADQHRSAFSGRNNEYYSQDAFHSGTIGAAVIHGVQSKGVVCYIKHIFINDQETNRGADYEFVTEQAIREVYAKQFQICLQEGNCKAGMTGYGHIAGFANTSNYNIGTELYQNQWGVHAYFVTDGYIGWRTRASLDIMVRTGIQMELYTTPFVEYLAGEWDAEKNTVIVGAGTYDREQGAYIKNGEDVSVESPTQWYAVRRSAHSILFQISDMAAQFNGYSELAISGSLKNATQGVSYSGSVSIDRLLTDGSSATSTVSGTLPEGLSINASTGAISGTTTEVGTYKFTVNYVIDGYVEKSAEYTLVVDSAFFFDEDGDPIDEAQIGVDFFAMIVSNEFKTPTYKSVSYAIKEGALPAGVELAEDGTIEGTPTEAGRFPVTVEITSVKETTTGGGKSKDGGNNQGTTTRTETKLEFKFTMVVADEDGNVPADDPGVNPGDDPKGPGTGDDPVIEPGDDEELTIEKVQEMIEAAKLQGKDGKDGKDGVDGKDGKDGKDGVGVDKISVAAISGGTEYTITFTDDRDPVVVTIKDGAAIATEGCGGFIGIGAGALAIITMIGAAVIIRKKED